MDKQTTILKKYCDKVKKENKYIRIQYVHYLYGPLKDLYEYIYPNFKVVKHILNSGKLNKEVHEKTMLAAGPMIIPNKENDNGVKTEEELYKSIRSKLDKGPAIKEDAFYYRKGNGLK